MLRFGTRSTTRRRTASTGSVPPQWQYSRAIHALCHSRNLPHTRTIRIASARPSARCVTTHDSPLNVSSIDKGVINQWCHWTVNIYAQIIWHTVEQETNDILTWHLSFNSTSHRCITNIHCVYHCGRHGLHQAQICCQTDRQTYRLFTVLDNY